MKSKNVYVSAADAGTVDTFRHEAKVRGYSPSRVLVILMKQWVQMIKNKEK